jgi:hypothetical protein
MTRAAGRLGASLGITTVLHTWARDLSFHPHVHCIVTGGGLSADGQRWLATSRKHLFPAAVLGALFRGKLLAALLAAHHAGVLRSPPDADPEALPRLLWRLRHKRWVIYAKRPFAGIVCPPGAAVDLGVSLVRQTTAPCAVSFNRPLQLTSAVGRPLRGLPLALAAERDIVGRTTTWPWRSPRYRAL